MSSLQSRHREGVFKPLDTLSSSSPPTFQAPATDTMVNEREPPRDVKNQEPIQNPQLKQADGPQFGKSSPLRNPLKKNSLNIFHMPNRTGTRPEHHRPPSHGSQNSVSKNPPFRIPLSMPRPNTSSPDVVEIPRPAHFPPPTLYPAPQQTFSTTGSFRPVNAFKSSNGSAFVDLTTRDKDDGFDPNKVNSGGNFDPSNFMSAAKANENIKALLEGVFDDDEDGKPQTRLRKRKQDCAAAALAGHMQNLSVDGKEISQTPGPEEVEEDDGSVEGMNIKLLPHQIDGLAWMIDKEIGTRKKNGVLPKGGILADDMGLGKTIQALSLILSNPRPSSEDLVDNQSVKVPEAAGKGTLVVAPLALIKQWESEIKTKVDTFPKLKVLVHHGPSRTRRFEDLKRQDIVITTYQTLTSEHEGSSDDEHGLKYGCFGVHWYRVILDEAHSIKNRNAKMTKAAYSLESVYRWCMTGTPMQNNLEELQSLIKFLRIKPYNDIKAWRDQISTPMKNGRGGLAMKRLQYFLKAFMKRRTKDVLKKEGALSFGRTGAASNNADNDGFKIVARNIRNIVVDFDKAERDFYNKLEARTSANLAIIMDGEKHNYIGALVLLLRLRQTCNHPQLSRGNLRKEKQSLPSTNSYTRANDVEDPTHTKSAPYDEADDVAIMLGAMTIANKTCDACGSMLDQIERDAGAIRCTACEKDFECLQRQEHSRIKGQVKVQTNSSRRLQDTRRIIDSDDEDDEVTERILPTEDQDFSIPNKVKGNNDESYENGGDRLSVNDSEKAEKLANKSHDTSESPRGDGPHVDNDDDKSDEEVWDNSQDESEALGFSTLPQGSTKIRKLIQILDTESDEHKFIVFSEFTSMLDLVEPFLHDAGFGFVRYDGKMKNDEREASLESLRNNAKVRILLCSLRCGSLGLNLTAASRVVILEPFWNPFVEEQAIDRVHRLNQTQDVTVYRLTVSNSVEQRILELQEKKRLLANAAIEGGKAVAKLSMQDIMDLFKRDAERENSHEDDLSVALRSGKPSGVLQSPMSKPRPPMSHVENPVQPSSQQTLYRHRFKKAANYHVPSTLHTEYEPVYSRRW